MILMTTNFKHKFFHTPFNNEEGKPLFKNKSL